MRTLGALAGAVASSAKTLCTCVRIDLRDGTSIGLTDHDRDIVFAEVGGSLTYSAKQGVLPSDIVLRAGLEPDNCDLSGPLRGEFTRAGLLGGRFRRATIRIFRVNWRTLIGFAPLMRGKVGKPSIEGRTFTLQLFGITKDYDQVVGSVLTPKCRTFFGSALCGVVREEFNTTLTAVTSAFQFTVDVASIPGSPETNFRFGSLTFTDGELLGIPEDRFISFNQATGAIEMWVPFPVVPTIGDGLTIYNGCSLLRMSADPDVPTCLTYENVDRFRGFPHVPSSANYNKISVPGSNA